MASEQGAMLKALIPLRSMPAVTAAYDKALKAIEQRHKPLAKGPHRARWDAGMVERLRLLWAFHNGNAYRVARDLRVTERAARRAYERFLIAGTPPTSQPQARLARAA